MMWVEAMVHRVAWCICCLTTLCAAGASRADTARPPFDGDGTPESWEYALREPINETKLSEGAKQQLAFLRLIQSARDVDLCDKQAVGQHFGPWLGEMLDLIDLEERSAGQKQRLKDLYEHSLGFQPYWSDKVRDQTVRCGLWLQFGRVAGGETLARQFEPFDPVLANHVFHLCAIWMRRLPHGQIQESYVQCQPHPSGTEVHVSLFNRRLDGISLVRYKAGMQPRWRETE